MRYILLLSILFGLAAPMRGPEPVGGLEPAVRGPEPFILEHERDIAQVQPGPHNGTGTTIAYSFFAHAQGLTLVFRKRVLLPGASIGYHLQEKDEIYYILSGSGTMRMNDSSFTVRAGDAVLTRPGSSHGVFAGADTLVVLINYLQK